jgi:hypothetical protein
MTGSDDKHIINLSGAFTSSNRGVRYDVPTSHLGNPLNSTPHVVARLALQFYSNSVSERKDHSVLK